MARPADTSEAAAIVEVVAGALAMEALTVAIITSDSLDLEFQGEEMASSRCTASSGKGHAQRLGKRRKRAEG